jgi:hypothetical protein
MGVPLRENHGVAGAESHRRLGAHLDKTLTFRDEVENHHPLGTGLEQRRCRIGTWRLVTPRRAEAPFNEYGAHKPHDP